MSTASIAVRPRRGRRTAPLRAWVRETRLTPANLICPLFLTDGRDVEEAIPSLPGLFRRSSDRAAIYMKEVAGAGIPAVLLFGIPSTKDATGSAAWDYNGPVPRGIAAVKERSPDTIVIADVCLCAYTDHGHCGVATRRGEVRNDATLELLARTAVAYARAGADVVAPSAMMDAQVGVIRAALDRAGFHDVSILGYSAKFASAFYGPFRDAAKSSPATGDRKGYQLDAANLREALREVRLDVNEGADAVMIKPAGPYLDVIRSARAAVDVPIAAYQVSGEFAMLKAAAERGWIDERNAVLESLVAIKRAGADFIVSYYALDAARWLADSVEYL